VKIPDTGFGSGPAYPVIVLAVLSASLLAISPPSAMAAIIFESEFGTGAINKFMPDGTQSVFATGLSHPAGLAFDASGNLFVADEGAGAIYRFSPAGIRSTFATGVGNPYGLAFDHSGNLYASDLQPSENRIYKFSPSGARTTFVGSGLLSPAGLAFDTSGNLYAADFNRIAKITPGGAVSTFADASNGAIGLAFAASGDLYIHPTFLRRGQIDRGAKDGLDVW
jgi:sugar lactone lactonase YvrE